MAHTPVRPYQPKSSWLPVFVLDSDWTVYAESDLVHVDSVTQPLGIFLHDEQSKEGSCPPTSFSIVDQILGWILLKCANQALFTDHSLVAQKPNYSFWFSILLQTWRYSIWMSIDKFKNVHSCKQRWLLSVKGQRWKNIAFCFSLIAVFIVKNNNFV